MRSPFLRVIGSLFLVLALQGTSLLGLDVPSGPSGPVPAPDMGEKLFQYEERLQNFFEGVEQQVEDTVQEEVAERPTALTPASGFAERVTGTINDFLPYLQFAVNTVTSSDDGTAVTVKFNPLDTGRGALALSATASEPEVYSPLMEQINESARAAQKDALLDGVDDFGDVTATLTYGFQRPGGRFGNTRKMFGRNVALYQDLITDLVKGSQSSHEKAVAADLALSPFQREITANMTGNVNVSDLEMGTIRTALGDTRFAAFLTAVASAKAAIADISLELQAADLDALAAFISNQPQATLSITRQVREEVAGPESLSATLSYEMGTRNFNTVLREYRRMMNNRRDGEPEPTPLSAFSAVAKNPRYSNEDKFVFSLTYKDVEDYAFNHSYQEVAVDPDTGAESRFDRVAEVRAPGSTEWHGNVTWTRLMPKLPFAAKRLAEGDAPRVTFSLEAVDISGDPNRQSHVIGKLGFVMPLNDSMALPITFTYADRPELLTDQDEVFGGHIGITYRLQRDGEDDE